MRDRIRAPSIRGIYKWKARPADAVEQQEEPGCLSYILGHFPFSNCGRRILC